MAKITNPFFSISAHGSIAKAITMQKQHGRTHCKTWAKPTGPASVTQALRRAVFRQAAENWKAMPEPEKAAWKAQGEARQITGWNAYSGSILSTMPSGTVTQWDAPRTLWDSDLTAWID